MLCGYKGSNALERRFERLGQAMLSYVDHQEIYAPGLKDRRYKRLQTNGSGDQHRVAVTVKTV